LPLGLKDSRWNGFCFKCLPRSMTFGIFIYTYVFIVLILFAEFQKYNNSLSTWPQSTDLYVRVRM
jgi:hypothetical protein